MAVNKDVHIPINNVVANPWIGPVPKISRIKPVRPVVMLASKIEESALLKPSLIRLILACENLLSLNLLMRNHKAGK